VKTDGAWQLVDATWGSGGSTSEDEKEIYFSEIDMRYFFADPKDFVTDHFPADSKWQLLDKPISKREFYSDDYELKRLAKLGW
jgi:transglutaminase/protease-like cytokinesis protein 3